MEITRAWQPDGEDDKWASVAVKPVRKLEKPVTLEAIKAAPQLKALEMVRQSRLSVTPVRDEEWTQLLTMGA